MRNRKKSIPVLLIVLLIGILPVFSQQIDPEIAFAKAFDLFRQGNYSDAAQAYGWLFSETSKLPGDLAEQSAYMQMISTFNAGRYAEAKLLAEAYRDRFPDSERMTDIQYQLARIALAEKNYEESIQMFSDIIAAHEADLNLRELVSQAYFWRAESKYQRGLLAEAFSEFAALVEKYPETSKKNEALQRIELIGAVSRERFQSRVIEFNLKESLEKQSRAEQTEKFAEQLLERYALLVRKLRSLYGLAEPLGRLPLYANAIALPSAPVPAAPPAPVVKVEQPQPKSQTPNLDVARNTRLKKLLSAKQRLLALLAETLLNYAEEVLK